MDEDDPKFAAEVELLNQIIGHLLNRPDASGLAESTVLSVRRLTLGSTVATLERYDFEYNPVDELTGAMLTNTSTSALVKSFGCSYDGAVNRTSEQVDSTVRSASFNTLNQQTASGVGGSTRFSGALNEPGNVTVGGVKAFTYGGTNFQANVNLSVGTNSIPVVAKDTNNNARTNTYTVVVPSGAIKTLTYDANGNMLSDGANAYTWDLNNRLAEITYPDGSKSDFTYDVFGRRVKIVEKDGSSAVTSTKQFAWQGLNIAEERDSSDVVTKRYYADGYRDVAGSASYFYTKDHLGSIREVTDGSAALTARYDYDPYGRVTKMSGSGQSDFLYTGHYYHAPSGLFLAPYRAYDANLGRWNSRDPIGEQGEDKTFMGTYPIAR